MIEVKDLIKLSDDREYCVALKTIFEGNKYYFLVDIDDADNIKVCYEKEENNNIKLVQVEDENTLDRLMLLFTETVKNN